MRTRCALAALLLAALTPPAPAQKQQPAPGDPKPILRLEAGGPTSNVTALAFSPDGGTLYAAGFDKVVRAWALNDKTGRFELRPEVYFRVPIGPGTRGAVNALALSGDGKLLAVGGNGVFRGGSGFDGIGVLVPSAGMSGDMREDEGVVYVFDGAKRTLLHTLRGHSGPVRALAFAPSAKGQAPVLVSAARGHVEKATHQGEVRVWDLDTGKEVASLAGLPDPQSYPRPAIAVRRTGDGAKAVRVALALGDGSLRVWSAGKGGQPAEAKAGRLNNSLTLLPDGRLLGGSLPDKRSNGRLHLWSMDAADEGGVDLAAPASGLALPLAVGTLASRGDGKVDAVAVVEGRIVAGKPPQHSYFVELRDLKKGLAVVRRAPLWDGSTAFPALATAPGGKHLAVAGAGDHGIWIFRVEDFKDPQIVQSAGTAFRGVAFATRGKGKERATGLLLDETGGGKLAFNFTDGSVGDAKGWDADAPKLAGWSVEPSSVEGGRQFRVTGPGKGATVAVKAPQTALAYALVPPRPGLAVPLLAVSVFDPTSADSFIELYDGASGEHVVRFTGHLAPARALAVSGDGRLLASGSDDQTVCLWSLAEPDKLVGKVGGLRGLAVKDGAKGGAVVAIADPTNPATKALPAGAVIEAVVEGGKLLPLASARAFYEAVWSRGPGAAMTVRVRLGNEVNDVEVRLGQGTQERNPLMTLFVTRPAAGQRDWLGWHPGGHFDSSRPAAEQYAGWHFNTGKPAAPTEFARIDQYPKKYRVKGLLNKLVELADIGKAIAALPPEKRPLPALQLEILVDGKEVRPDDKAQHLVRARTVELRLSAGDSFKPEDDDAFTWKLGGQPAAKFETAGFNRWTAKVELPPGQLHRVEAEARLHDRPDEPQRTTALTLRYQPPAPALAYAGPMQTTVMNPKFPFTVKVRPTAGGGPAEVTLVHSHNDKSVYKTVAVWDAAKEYAEPLTLRPGLNLVTVRARNKTAAGEFAALEADELTVELVYEPEKVARPAVGIGELFARPEGAPERRIELVAGRAAVVDVPKIRIKGSVKAEEALTFADLVQGNDRLGLKRTPDKKGAVVDQEVTLKPGKQLIRVQAKTGTSEMGEAVVEVFYRPKLPQVALDPPVAGLVVYDDGDPKSREITVTGKLSWPRDRSPVVFPIRAAVVVNGEELKAPAAIQGDTFRADKVLLAPGQNQILVRLSHAHGGEPGVAYLYLRVRQLPLEVNWDPPKVGPKPYIDLTARVRSPLPLLPKRSVVQVNGENLNLVPEGPEMEQEGLYRVLLKNVPLVQGKNEVRLWVHNADGEIRAPGTIEIKYEKPPAKPPHITVVSPAEASRTLNDPAAEFHFRVKSETRLARLELWRGAKLLYQAKPAELGQREFIAKVTLDWDVNPLHVEAANDGGVTREKLTVSVIPMPARVEVTRLKAVNRAGKQTAELINTGPSAHFGKAPDPTVWVHGTVRWASPHDPHLDGDWQVRLRVNGFQQIPATLEPRKPGATERHFKAAAALPAGTNRVEIDLPGVTLSGDSGKSFTVDCAAPGMAPRLHVVVIAPREADATEVGKGLDKALAGVKGGKAFVVQVHPALTEDSVPSDVFRELLRIHNKEIKPRASDGFATNDLVVVYYHGTETREKGRHYLWMGATRAERDLGTTGVDVALMEREFANFLGAQVLLLDVAAAGKGEAPPERPRHGVLRLTGKANPKAARLLEALGQVLPKAATLLELNYGLGQHFGTPQVVQQGSSFAGYLPPDLDVPFRK